MSDALLQRKYVPRTITEAGRIVGFKIDNPDGSALLIKCAGGTTSEEAWEHTQRLAKSGNALSPLTVEAIEQIQPMDFAHWKLLAWRVGELERALREIQGMATNAGYDSCNSAIYAVADKALHDPTSAALATVPAAKEEGE